MTKPKRRRLTQAEFEAELARAQDAHRAAHVPEARPLITRTGRRKSWWQRGWKR